MRWLAMLLALSGCAYAPQPSQVSVPGRISGDVLDHWGVAIDTGWIVPLVLEERAPRRSQLGLVVTYKGAF